MNGVWGLRLQNSAAGVISKTIQYTSIMPIPDELRWRPINKRCQFKILLLLFKSLNGCVIYSKYIPTCSRGVVASAPDIERAE